MEKNITIVNFELGNLYNVKKACEFLGMHATISSLANDVTHADAIILPGVGSFSDAMSNMKKLNLIEPVLNHIKNKKPFMGICLGMQLLMNESEEFGKHPGLGIIKGKVKRFLFDENYKNLKVPHVGWNKIEITHQDHWMYQNIPQHSYQYFVHSYYVELEESHPQTVTQYGDKKFCSSLANDHLFASQFHPEKSGNVGLEFLRNFKNHFSL